MRLVLVTRNLSVMKGLPLDWCDNDDYRIGDYVSCDWYFKHALLSRRFGWKGVRVLECDDKDLKKVGVTKNKPFHPSPSLSTYPQPPDAMDPCLSDSFHRTFPDRAFIPEASTLGHGFREYAQPSRDAGDKTTPILAVCFECHLTCVSFSHRSPLDLVCVG